MASHHHRLFLALWPDAAVARQLAAQSARWVWPAGCALQAPADWHVTLHFIGTVDAQHLPRIARAVDLAVEPFCLRLDQPLLWPHGLAVLCASQTPAPLHALHQQLGQALQGQGVAVDPRPYRPHATLARHAQAAQAPARCPPVEWPASRFVLAGSTGGHVPRYQVLRRYG